MKETNKEEIAILYAIYIFPMIFPILSDVELMEEIKEEYDKEKSE